MAIPQTLFRLFPAGAFLLAAAAGAAEEVSAPAIELPQTIVTADRELPPPENWRYAEIPGFEILTNASDPATQKLLHDFQAFNSAVDVVWHGLQQKNAVPLALILCGKGGAFEVFAPGRKNTPDAGKATLFLEDREQAAIVLDLEAKGVNSTRVAVQNAAATAATDAGSDPSTGAGAPSRSVVEADPHRQLYREYLRYHMGRSQPRLPPWFEEGLAQLFMGMTFDSRTITFGKLESARSASRSGAREEGDFNQALDGRALIPLPEFFAVERDSAVALNPVGSVWAKQAQALVHLCLYGEGQKYQKSVLTFVARLEKEPASEKLFKDCFGMAYSEMAVALRGYQQSVTYKAFEWHLPKGQSIPAPPVVALRDATQSEVGRIKGDALRLAGRAELAHALLVAPYLRGERDPRLLAALGLEEMAAGHSERARKFLELAVQANVSRPSVYVTLARLRFEAAKAAATQGKLEASEVGQILELLFRARPLPPVTPELYTLIAETWALSAVAPSRDHFEAVLEGVRLFPRNIELLYQAALLASQRGFTAEASALAALGRKNSVEPADKTKFEMLAAAIARDAAAAFSSPKP